MTSINDAAEWMLRRVERSGVLHQDDAVSGIADKFGEGTTYENAAGNPAISKEVLSKFKRISPEIVWHEARGVGGSARKATSQAVTNLSDGCISGIASAVAIDLSSATVR